MNDKIEFKEGDLVAVSLKENNTLRHCFGKCLGTVAKDGLKYVVNVFGVGLRTIDPGNPYYPLMSKGEGDRLEPHTSAYERTPCRRIDSPRFQIERDPQKRLYHLVVWSFAMGTSTRWVPYEEMITNTIDEFVTHATGENGVLNGTVGPWTVFTTSLVEAEVKEGTDPFDRQH